MYLANSDFPISIRSTDQKYAIFNSQGRCVLAIKKKDWGKFEPNPALTNLCTKSEYEEIQYSSVDWVKNTLTLDSGSGQLFDIYAHAMSKGLIPNSDQLEHMRVLIQVAMATI